MELDETIQLRSFFAALSDENRLKIAAAIIDSPRSVRELAAELSMKDAAVSKHLHILADAGIVRAVDDDSTRYQLDIISLRSWRKLLLTRQREPSPADDADTPEGSRLILSRFFDGTRLKDIPTDGRKRLIVLSWLAGQFEENREYPEREVNLIIKRHHPDASALRRYLIDHRFMQRENGVYWRLPADRQ